MLGSSLGKHGYVIEIIEIKDEDIIVGLIDNDSGAVNITAWYNAILLRPFPNEILDSIVTNTNEVSLCLTFCLLALSLVFPLINRRAVSLRLLDPSQYLSADMS